MKKIRNRTEIVEKMEEIYSLLHEKKLPLEYAIIVTDTLEWCIGDNDYLDTNKLLFRGELMQDDNS